MDIVLQRTYLGNTVGHYGIALGILAGAWLVLFLTRLILLHRLEKWAAATETTFDDLLVSLLKEAVFPLLRAGAVVLALRGLNLHPSLARLLTLAWTGLLTFTGARSILRVILYVLKDRWAAGEPGPSLALQALQPVIKTAAWSLGLIFFLDNAGVKISAVVTGLGIGGVAMALAAQTVLADLFSYIAILFDRPFAIGDLITFDGQTGSVDDIGIKTTRLRGPSGEMVIYPNSALTGGRVLNFRTMGRRRVVLTLGVTYETPTEKLKELPALLRGIVEKTPGVAFDRSHFAAFADSSLTFETVYFVETSDYNKFMDAQERINFAVKEEFDRRGVGFAYPTRTVHTVPAK